ncbi:hypothetical protein [Kozakia baliensis]|uniref:hypothetical protein n=2 Tax=Kozakia baliensis TaxID=153496 RepID=UPI000AEC0DAF|nr:hypothetical protein [Kozakia baliensis]
MMLAHPLRMTEALLSSERPSIRLHGARLYRCIVVIGWSERLAAERLGLHRTALRRAIAGTSSLAPDLSGWLLDLEAAHLAHPSPHIHKSTAGLRLAEQT